MKPPAHLPEDVAAVWLELAPHLDAHKLGAEFEAYCGAVARLRDAQKRLAEEGAIVPDGKQNPMPHPALLIERQAQEQLRKWGPKYRRKS
jgi:phage terminase small subunit